MALDNLKEQLKDQWADLSAKIQESSTFNNLREKFESQSSTIQRAIVFGAAGFLALMLLWFPWSYIGDSQDIMANFEDNRSLIQGLLHASRSVKEPSPLPPPVPADVLKGRIDAIIRENRLIPDQIGEIVPLPDRPAKDLAPAVVLQAGLAVQLKKLNLEQIVAVSHDLQNLTPGTKLMSLDIVQSGGQDHYYDMIAHVVNFALPEMKIEEPVEKGAKKGAKKRPVKSDEELGD